LLDLVHADGACLRVGESFLRFGDAPSFEEASCVMNSLNIENSEIYATDHLKCADFDSAFKGIVATKLSALDDIWLLWVRPEVISEVAWAGEPIKIGTEHMTEQLHPCRSFCEKNRRTGRRRGYCRIGTRCRVMFHIYVEKSLG
jgi:light-regulated signal transduction histidine kinase (bacteriophytochrome)